MAVLGIVVLLGVQTRISMAGHGIFLDCSSLGMRVIALLNQQPTDTCWALKTGLLICFFLPKSLTITHI